MRPEVARKILENIHIRYLTKHLNLKDRSNLPGWDLYTDKHNFEMKSARCYLDRGRAPPDNAWFPLHEEQIKDYEKKSEKELYWIFVAFVPRKLLKDTKEEELTERFVVSRDIAIAPWDVYKHFPLGNAKRDSLRGPGRSPSIKRVKDLFFKKQYKLHKADLHLPEHGALDYLLKYTLD